MALEQRLLRALKWREAPIPGGTPPAHMVRLPGRETFSAMVRFPPGWRRPTAGAYAVDETVVVLTGDLTVNGVTVHGERLLWIPSMASRVDSLSHGGALCFARFSGPPIWQEGAGERLPLAAPTPGQPAITPLGVWGYALDTHGGPDVWVSDGLPAMSTPRALEVIAPQAGMWLRAGAGDRLPGLRGRCWTVLCD
jgi:hypothetical protein